MQASIFYKAHSPKINWFDCKALASQLIKGIILYFITGKFLNIFAQCF